LHRHHESSESPQKRILNAGILSACGPAGKRVFWTAVQVFFPSAAGRGGDGCRGGKRPWRAFSTYSQADRVASPDAMPPAVGILGIPTDRPKWKKAMEGFFHV